MAFLKSKFWWNLQNHQMCPAIWRWLKWAVDRSSYRGGVPLTEIPPFWATSSNISPSNLPTLEHQYWIPRSTGPPQPPSISHCRQSTQEYEGIYHLDFRHNKLECCGKFWNVCTSCGAFDHSLDGHFRDQATLASLHPSTTYLVRMLAVNEIERSAFTDPIVVKTQEEAPTEPPQNIQVQTGSIGELIVTWQLPRRESWNGELIGYTVNCSEEKQNINYISSNVTTKKSIRVDGFATTKTTLTNLRTFRRYSIIVRASNGFGPGPWSVPVYGTTLEGVPEAPPQLVNCVALSSQSIKISWQEPPLQYHGGVIQGYKILYRPMVQSSDVPYSNEVKRTSNLETYLHALLKASNYSIRVLAYTSSGDGAHSSAIYCCTEEDVPEPPANIKAAALTGDSILVSWLPPKHRNGIIQHYTVYSREGGRKDQPRTHLVRVDDDGNPTRFEARSLLENQTYEFWVSASTSIGEGEPTTVASQTTNTKAPARIASFTQIIRKAVGNSLLLPCLAVGNPTPRARWFTRDRPVTFSTFYEISAEGNLHIHSVESSLSGNYTCSAKNLFGEDQIVYKVIAMKPPSPPQINVHFASADSIRITWETSDDGGASIQGYIVSYRMVTGAWIKVDLTPENTGFTINHLKCGTQYIIKVSAYNRVGDGQSTEEINVWTKGKSKLVNGFVVSLRIGFPSLFFRSTESLEPEEQDFIQSNSTCINLHLVAWNNGGCPITHFSVEHRAHGEYLISAKTDFQRHSPVAFSNFLRHTFRWHSIFDIYFVCRLLVDISHFVGIRGQIIRLLYRKSSFEVESTTSQFTWAALNYNYSHNPNQNSNRKYRRWWKKHWIVYATI